MTKILLPFSFLSLVFKRLAHHFGLSLSSALGILSILSLIICVPVFANGILSQVLQEQLAEKAARNQRAMFSIHAYYPDNKDYTALNLESAGEITNYIQRYLHDLMGLQVSEIALEVNSSQYGWRPVKIQSTRPAFDLLYMSFKSSTILADKIKMVEGKWPQNDKTLTNPIQVAVLEDFADEYFLNVGDIYQSGSITIELVGVFRAIDPNDLTWFYNPQTTFRGSFWVPMTFFQDSPHPFLERSFHYTSWYAIVKDSSLRFSQSIDYTRQMARLESTLLSMLPKGSIDYSPSDMLKAYETRLQTMIVLFYAAGAPVFALALLFVWLTASIAVRQHEQETAVIKARGGSKGKIIVLNLVESLVLVALVLPLAMLAGWAAAGLMGQTRSFMQFIYRPGMVFHLNDINLTWLSVAVLAVLLARLAPLLFGSWPSIHLYKQERARGALKPFWERYYIDLFLIIPAVYAFLTLRGRAQASLTSPEAASQNGYDPLMFLASSLCIFALCMLILRLFPLMLRLLAAVASRLPHAWVYLALQELGRKPRDHASAVLLIMISLSFSIFSASMAKTLDRWLRDSEFYRAGTDLVIKEYEIPTDDGFGSAPPPSSSDPTAATSQAVESLVSLEKKLQLPGVLSGTFVGKWPCRYSYGARLNECTLMGIDRLSFPAVAFFRRDFAAPPLGALMNDLISQPLGVLIPQRLAQETGLQPGDLIQLESSLGAFNELVNENMHIVGIYDYFPTVYSYERTTLIANLESIFGGPDAVTGVDIWLKLGSGANPDTILEELRAVALRSGRWVDLLADAGSAVAQNTSQPEWVGLFGILNVGFLLTGILPGIGFVLYSFALLRNRLAQFGILQALGFTAAQTAFSLTLEQILLMGMALVGGAGAGFVTSALFLPFLQTNLAGTTPTPPFLVLIGWTEAGWLCLVFGGVFAITLAFMLAFLSRLKIFQTLKLGEDA